MGMQSPSDYGVGFATLGPSLYPRIIGTLLRNLKPALKNIVDAQNEIRFRQIEYERQRILVKYEMPCLTTITI